MPGVRTYREVLLKPNKRMRRQSGDRAIVQLSKGQYPDEEARKAMKFIVRMSGLERV